MLMSKIVSNDVSKDSPIAGFSFDINMIFFCRQSAHKFDPLPPGWFYNGLHFVSLNGEKDYSHPRILLRSNRMNTLFVSS